MFEFTGEVVKVGQPRAVGAKQRLRRDLWVKETPEGKYANIVPFVLKGEKVNAANNLKEGDEVKIGFVLEGYVWEKNGEKKCFGSNVCLKMDVVSANTPPAIPLKDQASEDDIDMPF